MKRILGLDLGTASIGWALVNEKENESEQSSIVRMGVRVNPLTVDEETNYEKGKSITTNADRRQKRSMRRNLQRFKLRRKNLVDCLHSHGIITEATKLYEADNRTTFSTYRARAKAVTGEISLDDFARVMMMLNKKRGYKSNRKAKGDDEGELIDGMDVAKRLYNEHLTPGQLLFELYKKGKKSRPSFYRSDLQSEFDSIWAVQRNYYPDVLTDSFKKAITGFNKGQTAGAFFHQHNISTAKNSGKEAYYTSLLWRIKALTKQIDIEEVAYVLADLNGAINNSSNRLAMISDRSKELYFNKQTIGQYLMQRLNENPNASLTNIIFYRQDYLDEFEKIWECQEKYHPELTPELKSELRDIIIFYQRNLKSCKNLVGYCELEHKERTVTGADGKEKTINIGPKVCPKSSPLFQDFKTWQVINNLQVNVIGHRRRKLKTDNRQLSLFADDEVEALQRFLTLEEKKKLFKELTVKGKLPKKKILKLLFEKPDELDLNYNEVEGNRTMAAIYDACRQIISLSGHGEYDFSKMPAEDAHSLITEIFSGLGYKTDFLTFNPLLEGKAMEQQPAYKLWHLLYSYVGDNSKTGTDALIKRIEEICGFNEEDKEYAQVFAKISFAPDYGNLSTKAIRKILPYMMLGNNYYDACDKAGYKHSARSLTKEELNAKTYVDHIDILPRNSLHNPVVEKILNQMINVVNEVAQVYGKPDEIRIEMARELKKSQDERQQMDKAIRENTAKSEEIRKTLERDFGMKHATRNDILRYRLYEELGNNGHKTLYTGTYIPKEELFSKRFDIEHIIPQARLFDDSYSNKTLESRSANIEKGNMTAYDYVKQKYGDEGVVKYEERVKDLYEQNAISKTKYKHLLMSVDDIPEDFLNRDLGNSQYIARKACEILEQMVPVVNTTTGSITSRLREDWQLVDIMKELDWDKYNSQGLTETYTDNEGRVVKQIKDWTKRNDQRHHAMDALTIAFTKPSIVQYLNNLNARSNKSSSIYGIQQKELHRNAKSGKLVFNAPIPLDQFRAEAKKHLQSILVSIKAKNKVTTKNINRYKTKKGKHQRVQLTPRGALHNETVYGKITNFEAEYKKVGAKFTEDVCLRATNHKYREALLARLTEYGGDPKKAFTGRNSLEKNPLWLNTDHSESVPTTVKLYKKIDVFTIIKPVDANLKIEKVIDPKIRAILNERLAEFKGNATEAFSNLEENPIWLNKDKGIAIKRVKIRAAITGVAIRDKRDIEGKIMKDVEGKPIPNDYVTTAGNHHSAIFRDADGNLQEHVVSFFEATARSIAGLPIVDKDYNHDKGWKFLFTIKQNEYFVFPNPQTGFDPHEIDLTDKRNFATISPNLYRAQKLSKGKYMFRHHLETNVDEIKELKGVTWKFIQSLKNLEEIVKVRIDHIGNIVAIGEY